MKKLIFFECMFLMLLPFCAFADNNAGFFSSNITPSSSVNLKINGFAINGEVYNFDIVWNPTGGYFDIQNLVTNSCFLSAPVEQWETKRYAQTPYSSPPFGYTSVIGWVLGVNNGSGNGYVVIKSLKVYGKDTEGIVHLISDKITCDTCTKADDKVFGFHIPKSKWRDQSAWKANANGTAFNILSDGTVSIPTSTHPSDVYHMWNTESPRSTTTSGWTYMVQAEVWPQGSGMVQVGFDYYTTDGQVLEAGISNWNCATLNPVIVTAGF